MDTAPEFDVGPLSWVHGEIDQALGRGLDALALFKAVPKDTTTLKHARTHIHQAAGAIQMVGLDAVAAYTDEIERQLTRLEELPAAQVPAAVDLIDRACRKLRIFLDELVNGASPVPLKLFPEYETMQATRGIKAAAPTDLFYPDLGARPPKLAPREALSAARFQSHLVKQRRLYQRGLLAWLRGDAEGVIQMHDAIADIEAVTTQPSLRAFWWTASAMFEAMKGRGLQPSFGVKQLAARIDLQIRRVVGGSAKVADRLRREALYFVAISAPVGPQVQAVQKAFRLSGLIPSEEVLNADLVRIQPLLREARDQLATAKDSWLKFASGRAENLPKLKATLTSVHTKAAEVRNGALMKLTSALVGRLEKMPTSGVTEPVAMEFATALLLAESAFDNYSYLGPEFPKQVDAMVARLDAARTGRGAATAGAPALDEMSKRAQERMLLAQVGREIQTNLRHMEQVLDAFFRDNTKRAELAALAKDSQQIRGALSMLGLTEAERLLMSCQEQIDAYVHTDTQADNEDLEMLAESLSGLGFYIEAVEQQRPDRDRLIAPLLARRSGEPAATEQDDDAKSVESAVAELRAQLPKLVDEVRRAPSRASSRATLKSKLEALRDDAELIGDGTLAKQVEAALAEFGADGASLAKAVDAITDTTAQPAPELSDETRRLLETDATQFDSELLDIYLTEASDVLDDIGVHEKALAANPSDRDALRTVRRGFHTLKGSGRMVGLTDLGDLAYEVEKVLNRLLEEERAMSPAVLALITTSETAFREWITTLKATKRVTPDPTTLRAAIDAVLAELPPGPGPAAPTTPPSTTPPAKPRLVDLASAIESPPSIDRGPSHELSLVDHVDDAPAALPPAVAPAGSTASALTLAPMVELPELGAPLVRAPPVAIEDQASDSVEDAFDADPDLAATPSLRLVADNPQFEVATEEIEFPPLDELEFDAAAMPDPVAENETIPEGLAEVLPFAAPAAPGVAASPLAPAAVATVDDEPAKPPEDDADQVVIGGVTLSTTLFRILTDEADEHVATLQHELSLMQSDPQRAPSPTMIRASHTLCGMHRTAGFPLLATTAKALEHVLMALSESAPPLPSQAQPVLARAVTSLEDLVGRIKSCEAFGAGDEREAGETVAELEVLRQEVSAGGDATESDADAESLAALDAGLDDDMAAATLRAVPSAGDALPPPNSARPDIPADVDDDVAAAPGVAAPAAPTLVATSRLATEREPELTPVPANEPAAVLPLPGVDPLANIRDEVEPDVLPIFLDEAAELYPQAGDELRAWRRAPTQSNLPQQLRRTLHTFKGSARMAGAMRLGELAHLMESRMGDADASAAVSPDLFEALDGDLDQIAYVLDRLRAGELNSPLLTTVAAVAAEAAAGSVATPTTASPPERGAPVAEHPVVVPMTPVATSATPATTPAPAPQAESHEAEAGSRAMLRVRADTVDKLVNEAGEVAIARSRVEGELRTLKANLLELTGSVIRLRSQVREIEIQAEGQIQSRLSAMQEAHEGFDPLEFDRYTRFQELTRSIAEGVNDVSTVQQSLLKNLDDADAALSAQARLSREVQQKLFAIRTVPFGSVSERLYRILRTTARELDKRANLEITGAQVELDRSVLEKLIGPLEHLLRNALDHGLEARATRKATGKSETGELTLTVRQQGNEVVIALADDGAGIDLARVKERALAQKLIAPDATPTEAQLIECLFKPGFSTASRVTHISGRGVGMDVVRNEINALGGRVDVMTQAGKGSTFTLYLPLTLAVAQAVLVRAGGRLWALPAPMIEQVQQVKAEALVNLYIARKIAWQDGEYPFHYLPRLLGDLTHNPETQRFNPVLLVKSGQSAAAIHVDEVVGNQEIVVKNIGPQLARVSGISGATVLGNGEIVLILNPVQLAQRADISTSELDSERVVPSSLGGGVSRDSAVLLPTAPSAGPPMVLIVDDSLTVRKITSRLLQREGFAVATAKDGLDALERIAEQIPDIILLDIEMPRMDGFEFTKALKADQRNAHIPIIMITSRTAEKHRNRARELGVDLYLGKPYQEAELLKQLREMLDVQATA